MAATNKITFHKGELAAQDKAGTRGVANELLPGKQHGLNFASNHDAFLADQTFAVIASVVKNNKTKTQGGQYDDDSVWVTPLFGKPGDLSAASESKVVLDDSCIPPFDILRTAANSPGSPLALLGIDLKRRTRHRISGMVVGSASSNIHLEVNEYSPNCPKYINRRERIAAPVLTDALGNKVPTPILNKAAQRHKRTALSKDDQDMIAKMDTLWIGTVAGDAGGADVNHRGGKPGFVRVVSASLIEWPEYRGNGMFYSSGNLEVCDRAGVTLFDFETGDLLQLSGRAVVDWNHDGTYEGATRAIKFSIEEVVRVNNVTSHRWKLLDYSPYNPATGSGDGQQADATGFPITATLAKIVAEAPNVKTFRWVASRRIPFLPGQYATFEFEHLAGMSASNEATHVRTWTLSETPNSIQGDNTLDITVKRVPGGLVTNWLHDHAHIGLQVKLHGVQGELTAVRLDTATNKAVAPPHILLLSAGIGITPSMAMIRGVGAYEIEHQTTIAMIHVERNRSDLLFERELTRRVKKYPRFTRTTIITSEQGRLTRDQLEGLVPVPSKQEAYICGPASFMTAMTEHLVALGVPAANIHTESFSF